MRLWTGELAPHTTGQSHKGRQLRAVLTSFVSEMVVLMSSAEPEACIAAHRCSTLLWNGLKQRDTAADRPSNVTKFCEEKTNNCFLLQTDGHFILQPTSTLKTPIDWLTARVPPVLSFWWQGYRGVCWNDNTTDGKKKIAVIGAGVSGLCALKHLSQKSDKFIPTAFEKHYEVGGIWSYTEKTADEYGNQTHSGIYNNMMTNGPKQLMTIPGYPHDQSGNSYLRHPQILKYVQGFSDHFDLGQYVKLNTITKSIRPVPTDGDQVQWDVTYCNRHNVNEIDTQRFDGVIVSTGHYSKCHIPEVKGMDKFTGSVIHSRDYRRPEVYEGKRVLILGASFSGLDIAFDLSKKAKKIYMGHRDAGLQTQIPANVEERPDVSHLVEGNRVVFKDGSEADIDDLILCTGYSYTFPFLADDVIQLKDERITPLYKHLVHIKYKNLLFCGLARCVSYFAQSHEQARAASIILEGNVKFPTQQEMMDDADRDFEQKRKEFDMTHLHAHYMGKGDLQWRMNKDHAELCGFEMVPQVVKDMLEHVQNTRTRDFGNFRKKNYFYKDPHTFEVSN